MADPQSIDTAAHGPMSDAERDARIEQLLLSGLDRYFAGHYEHAINIWTRVAFLERGHGRAKAYIDRARGALAERQREAEELASAGVAAYNAGRMQVARELLTRATSTGNAGDTALLFIDRLRRFDAAAGVEYPATEAQREAATSLLAPERPDRRWLVTVVVSAAVAAAVLLVSLRMASWLAERPLVASVTPTVVSERLPIVRAADIWIDRARAQVAAGQAADALRTLERIDVADRRRPEADRLRADIQRGLLSTEAR